MKRGIRDLVSLVNALAKTTGDLSFAINLFSSGYDDWGKEELQKIRKRLDGFVEEIKQFEKTEKWNGMENKAVRDLMLEVLELTKATGELAWATHSFLRNSNAIGKDALKKTMNVLESVIEGIEQFLGEQTNEKVIRTFQTEGRPKERYALIHQKLKGPLEVEEQEEKLSIFGKGKITVIFEPEMKK
jgi:hypothetical protein